MFRELVSKVLCFKAYLDCGNIERRLLFRHCSRATLDEAKQMDCHFGREKRTDDAKVQNLKFSKLESVR